MIIRRNDNNCNPTGPLDHLLLRHHSLALKQTSPSSATKMNRFQNFDCTAKHFNPALWQIIAPQESKATP
jgi:hypothetical protein